MWLVFFIEETDKRDNQKIHKHFFFVFFLYFFLQALPKNRLLASHPVFVNTVDIISWPLGESILYVVFWSSSNQNSKPDLAENDRLPLLDP